MNLWYVFGLAILSQGFGFKIEGNLLSPCISQIPNLKNIEYVGSLNDQSNSQKQAQLGTLFNDIPISKIVSSPVFISNNNQGENKEYKIEKSIPVVLTQVQPKSTVFFQASPIQRIIETTQKPYSENFIINTSPVKSFECLCKPSKNEEQNSENQGIQSQTINMPLFQSLGNQNSKTTISSQVQGLQWISCGPTMEIPDVIVKKESEKQKNSQNIQLLEGNKPQSIQIPRLQLVNTQTCQGPKIDFVEAKELQTLEIPPIQFEDGNKVEAHKYGSVEKSQQIGTIVLRPAPFSYTLN